MGGSAGWCHTPNLCRTKRNNNISDYKFMMSAWAVVPCVYDVCTGRQNFSSLGNDFYCLSVALRSTESFNLCMNKFELLCRISTEIEIESGRKLGTKDALNNNNNNNNKAHLPLPVPARKCFSGNRPSVISQRAVKPLHGSVALEAASVSHQHPNTCRGAAKPKVPQTVRAAVKRSNNIFPFVESSAAEFFLAAALHARPTRWNPGLKIKI